MKRHLRIGALAVAIGILSTPIASQANPDHHPPALGADAGPSAMPPAPGMAAGPGPMPAPGAKTPAPGMGGMGAMMAPAAGGGCIGEGCGSGAAGTSLYASLMTMPELTPEKRAEIEALATRQIEAWATCSHDARTRPKLSSLLRRLASAGMRADEPITERHESIDPKARFTLAANPAIEPVADEADARMARVMASLA